MAARRLGLRALSAVPLLSSSAAGGCGGIARGFMAAAACEGQLTSSSSLLRRSAARHQWQPLQLLGSCRGFAQLPPHIEMQMPSLSPTMERVRPVCICRVCECCCMQVLRLQRSTFNHSSMMMCPANASA
jgi:hypothetical protein